VRVGVSVGVGVAHVVCAAPKYTASKWGVLVALLSILNSSRDGKDWPSELKATGTFSVAPLGSDAGIVIPLRSQVNPVP
jgi:hypothetical protein